MKKKKPCGILQELDQALDGRIDSIYNLLPSMRARDRLTTQRSCKKVMDFQGGKSGWNHYQGKEQLRVVWNNPQLCNILKGQPLYFIGRAM